MRAQTKRNDGWSMLVGLSLAAALLLAAFHFSSAEPPNTTWERVTFFGMVGYLVFLSFRSVVHLLFSFADRFFPRPLRAPTSFPLISVIVPCFNEETVVEQAVRSMLKIDYPNFEILVVDDGSTDLTLFSAKKLEAERNVRVIYQKNQGKAEALNRGVSEALGEYVLCVDADSVLHPNVLREGVPYFVSDPKLAAVAGTVSVGRGRGILTHFQRLEYIIGLNFYKTAQSFLSAVMIVPGPVGLFRRDFLLAVGGYRSTTFAEDCDLTLRLLMAGYRTAYCPTMIAVTEAPEDFPSLMKQRYRWSRGTFQAIKANSYWLWHPQKSLRNCAILAYFFFEALVIPTLNFLLALTFIQHAAITGSSLVLAPYFLQLAALDLILSAYSIIYEGDFRRLMALAAVNRITYGLAMEVLRFFSVVDELFGLPMNWNKLARRGL